jgi:hypothetical protein
VDVAYVERNAEGLKRLRALVERLSDRDLSRDLGGGWTVAVALAHLAFWDRYLAARWEHALREGLSAPEAVPDFVPRFINEAALGAWQVCLPREAARLALAAAGHIEGLLAKIDPSQAATALASGRPSLVDRTLHWFEHMEQIERALHASA